MTPTDTELKQAQIRGLEVDTLLTQARAIAELIRAVYRPDANAHPIDVARIVEAVTGNDLSIMAKPFEPPSSPGSPPLTP